MCRHADREKCSGIRCGNRESEKERGSRCRQGRFRRGMRRISRKAVITAISSLRHLEPVGLMRVFICWRKRGRNRPCIGFCMQKLLIEMQTEKNREGGCAGAG